MILPVWLRIISSMVGKIHPCPIVELIHIIEWLTFKIVSKLYRLTFKIVSKLYIYINIYIMDLLTFMEVSNP